MPFQIIRQDITKMHVDAIVNAANTELQMGGGVCGAIFRAAGAPELQSACHKLAPIKTGEAVITPGFALPAKYIIHTAGPVYRDGAQGEEQALRASYTNSLKRAVENGCVSIAFPLISSGIYGYPKAEAVRVARESIGDFLATEEMEVYLLVFSKEAFELSETLLGEVASYIDEHYVDERYETKRSRAFEIDRKIDFKEPTVANYQAAPQCLEDLINDLDQPFTEILMELIDKKGKTEVEVYKRANLDRKHFSKIRNNKNYLPKKRTVLALAIGLELSLAETQEFLESAGYALSHSHRFDVIIEYFLNTRNYDIYKINEVLFSYDQELLGV